MKKGDVRNSPSKITFGDVFDDIGLTPGEACEAKIKADLWRAVVDRIEEVNYSQGDLVQILKVHQPEVSHLLKGKISRFSVSKLISFAVRLDIDVQVHLTYREPKSSGFKAASSPGRKTRNLACV